MSYPYPPMDPGQPPSGGQPWGTPPPGGYGTPPGGGYPQSPISGWQGPETLPGGPPMGQPPMGQPPMGQFPPPKKSSAGLITLAIVGALILVGGVLGGAYYLAASGGSDGDTASSSASATPRSSSSGGAPPAASSGAGKPVTYNSMKSWSLWDSLNTASKDSKPLTLDEVFADPEAKSYKDSSDNTVFNVQGTGRLDTNCVGTVSGSALQTALQGYGCTQVVRAAYVSADQKWVGQMAIFNLKDVTSANAFIDDLDPKANKGFFLPVTGPSPVDKFGTSTTGAESGAYGHFVVVGWAGRADGGHGDSYGIDTISPSSTVLQAGKQFLFHRH
ncbi:hypothetical protein [Actinoallomurus iriomotensis]|uniref:Uncharacterized protein n=1 Tax=Actinoallomurus iriomotensis TaxID=478107 RepID=A0A9W6VRT7_9ACTN|nr:hypothetical protein [Actinoallomurus iriomotensis]GLY82628.1 hypothetical protein Airi02_005600 [Actinoallomurus iriomotensis]